MSLNRDVCGSPSLVHQREERVKGPSAQRQQTPRGVSKRDMDRFVSRIVCGFLFSSLLSQTPGTPSPPSSGRRDRSSDGNDSERGTPSKRSDRSDTPSHESKGEEGKKEKKKGKGSTENAGDGTKSPTKRGKGGKEDADVNSARSNNSDSSDKKTSSSKSTNRTEKAGNSERSHTSEGSADGDKKSKQSSKGEKKEKKAKGEDGEKEAKDQERKEKASKGEKEGKKGHQQKVTCKVGATKTHKISFKNKSEEEKVRLLSRVFLYLSLCFTRAHGVSTYTFSPEVQPHTPLGVLQSDQQITT